MLDTDDKYSQLSNNPISADSVDRISVAIRFLQSMKPTDFSPIEIEYAIMHTAYVVNEENSFKDNYNVAPDRRKQFAEHVEKVLDSDISAWTRKLYDLGYWRYDNFITCNLVWNWLNGSLTDPMGIL